MPGSLGSPGEFVSMSATGSWSQVTLQILLKLLLATVHPRRVVLLGYSHALVPKQD